MASAKSSPGVEKSNKKFQCTYKDCLKEFNTSSHLKRHENVHTDRIYRCEHCDALFSSSYSQKRHIDNKHLKKTPKKYQCEYCEEDFNKKSWLTRHLYRHTGILPYACPFEDCESRFLMPSMLKRHLKSHDGFYCPKENCNEKFAKWTELKSHLAAVHPTVHRCSQCNLKFSRLSNLKAHSVTHKSDSDRPVFLCPKTGCQRFYFKKSNLKQHIKSYHEKRPFNCTIGWCCKSFKSQKKLDDHICRNSLSEPLKKENLDDHVSRQSPSKEIMEDLDDQISRQSPSGEREKEDSDDTISRHSPSGRLKEATVIYLKTDYKSSLPCQTIE